MTKPPFDGFDFEDFWDPAEYYAEEYTDEPPTAETIASIEKELGYKLPAAYVALAAIRNGGSPKNGAHRAGPTTWAEDHVGITGIYSIGNRKPYSLGGQFGSRFWIEEWGYPPIGIYFADCPSAGHDMICLDYRKCGPDGEPAVVHVDQEDDYKITFLAESFEAFIRGLEDEEAFETD